VQLDQLRKKVRLAKFLRGLEVRHLAVLKAIADSGSFWAAAERLDLSPSAVSQHVSTLESVAGERLVERSRGRRRVELTEAGRLLLGHADAILARVRAAESDFAAFRDGAKGTLRVGTYQSIGARLLPRLLPRFASDWPDVEVHLVEGLPDERLLEQIESGELDLTFTTFPTSPGPFESLQLLDDRYVLTIARDAPLAQRRFVTVRELNQLKLIGIATCEAEITERFRTLGEDLEIWFPSGDNAVVQGLVAAGVGAAIVPLLTVDHTDKRVAIIGLDKVAPRILGLAWHADRFRSPACDAFRAATVRLCVELERELDEVLPRSPGA
jgi:molybdate transport repressor ModE-like protein